MELGLTSPREPCYQFYPDKSYRTVELILYEFIRRLLSSRIVTSYLSSIREVNKERWSAAIRDRSKRFKTSKIVDLIGVSPSRATASSTP